MTIIGCQKPEAFDFLPDLSECFEMRNGKGVYAHLGLAKVSKDSCSIHIQAYQWSHTIVKQARKDMEMLRQIYFVPKGIKRIIASFPDSEDRKWPKFIKLFGFDEPKKVLISIMEI